MGHCNTFPTVIFWRQKKLDDPQPSLADGKMT